MLPSLIALIALAACPAGYTALDEGACLSVPNGATKHLVVYFHGILSPKTPWEDAPEFQKIGAEAAQHNAAVLALRGRQGDCLWADDVRDYWCWPSAMSVLPEVGAVLTKRLGPALKLTRERLHAKKIKPVYAGFSNGGYFVTLLMSDTRIDARGYAVIHAGKFDGQVFDAMRAKPTLLVGATEDAIQFPAMKHLQEELRLAKWPATFNAHEGKHEISDDDARALFTFIDRIP